MFLCLVVGKSDWALAVKDKPKYKKNKAKVEKTLGIFNDKWITGMRSMN